MERSPFLYSREGDGHGYGHYTGNEYGAADVGDRSGSNEVWRISPEYFAEWVYEDMGDPLENTA